MDINDPLEYNIVEVSFKNGARKDFFKANPRVDAITGDLVSVEAGNGFDVGRISLSGELVRLQMRKKRVNEDRIMSKILRVANRRDVERLEESRSREKATMIKSRAIARSMGLEMKIGDVEFQADNRKATFYYTADGRVDFRELVRSYANEFKVKIEMRQIGSRQESARIGGLGPCGRELCCSTWLSDFKSVSTSAARYQNLAINQTKLSGQCGRLKCCLNFELDSYIDALETFPKKADRLRTAYHKYELIKTDIFKGIMYYIQILERGRGPILALDKDRVKEVLAMNKRKEYPEELGAITLASVAQETDDHDFEDVTGAIELPSVKKRRGKRKPQSRRKGDRGRGGNNRKDERGKGGRGEKTQGDKSPGDKNRPENKRGERGKGGDKRRDDRSNKEGRKDRPKNKGGNNRRKEDNRNDNRKKRPNRPAKGQQPRTKDNSERKGDNSKRPNDPNQKKTPPESKNKDGKKPPEDKKS